MMNLLINTISAIGLLFSIYLISKELKQSGYCPKFLQIPACYLVLLSFLLVLLSNTVVNSSILYFIGSVTGFVLALWFSYHEINQTKECPRLFMLPLCYVSLITFSLLIMLKLI